MRLTPVLLLSSALLAAADPVPFGSLVSVAGRRLHIHCTGKGAPVVLFLNGVPRFALHFALVQPEVAKFTTACVYDRAGDAWSETAGGPPSAAATRKELDAVVRHVSPNGPVVLAGHSFGGILARAYYAKHPDKVAAMVLIDSVADAPMVPVGETKKPMSQLTPDDIRALGPALRQRSGPPPATGIGPPFDRLPASLHEAHLWASRKWTELNNDPVDGLRYQVEFYRAVEGQPLGDLPLLVIARATSASAPEPWIDLQQRLAGLSRRGRLVRAVASGHDVELDQPGAVVDGIRGVVDSLGRPR